MVEQSVNIPWDGWKCVKPIGKGGFGAVYEIERVQHGIKEKAAMKRISIPQSSDEVDNLRIEGYDDESITQRFSSFAEDIIREYGMMVQMKGNANIVYCDDYKIIQQDEGFGWDIYIKMELLTPLVKALERVSTEEQLIRFGIDMCTALEVCQKRNVIHRDIKPQNIFVSEDGVFKLGDFGIARTAEKTTRATVGIGTYQFMAPEVKNDQPYGATVDIYSLGMVMYWLLNGRRTPFLPLPPAVPKHGEEERARQRRFAGERIPAPRDGSEALKQIVLKACTFDPKERYQSAREMREDLVRISGDAFSADDCQPVQKPEVVKDSRLSNDATFGPVSNRNIFLDMDEQDKTVGPVFGRNSAVAMDDSDKTVGPQFSEKAEETPEQLPKKKKLWPLFVIAACIIAIVVMLPLKKDEVPQAAENILIQDTFTSMEQAKEILGHAASGDQRRAYCAEQPAFGSNIPRGQIVSVTFLDTVADAPDDSWDVSYDRSGTVLAWAVPNGEYFDLYIAGEGGISGKEATPNMFYCYSNLREIHFNGNFHTEESVDMSSMFYQCRNLTHVDVSSLETSSAVTMANMFWACMSLKELNVSSFDTSAVTNMWGMFAFCENLKELDTSNFDTACVTNMYCMFTDCTSLERLDIRGFDTSAVTSMRQMFHNCNSLTELDVSGFNTSSVTNMGIMFQGCSSLRNLDVSGFDVSKVDTYDNFMDSGRTVNGQPWEEFFAKK